DRGDRGALAVLRVAVLRVAACWLASSWFAGSWLAVLRVAGGRAGHEHGRGGQQVAGGVDPDQPARAPDAQEDPAERAADQPDRAAAGRVQRVGAAQQLTGADDGRGAGLPGRDV